MGKWMEDGREIEFGVTVSLLCQDSFAIFFKTKFNDFKACSKFLFCFLRSGPFYLPPLNHPNSITLFCEAVLFLNV